MTEDALSPPRLMVGELDGGLRADGWLSAQLPALSRVRIQALLKDGHILLNGAVKASSYKVRPGDCFTVIIPDAVPADPIAQDLPLSIVYEDGDLLVLNKPAGLVVHPAPGNADGTLVNGLLAHCADGLSGIGGVKRPGIVHRLDKGTSGLMVVAKNDLAHGGLSAQFADRTLSRTYQALVWGAPLKPLDVVDAPIGRHPRDRLRMAVVTNGKPARTCYRLIQSFADRRVSFIECRLETGRTHQIRVHMTHIGHPLLNDHQYGARPLKGTAAITAHLQSLSLDPGRPLLHAISLTFVHPVTHETMTFHAPLPPDFDGALTLLKTL